MGWRGLFLAALALALTPLAARAVIVEEATWRAEGGQPGRWADGFDRHQALANQPQFAPMVSMGRQVSLSEPIVWGYGSSTWLGNDATGAYVLTAGHMVRDDQGRTRARDYRFRTPGGQILTGVAAWVNPLWRGNVQVRDGVDIAILKLDGLITDIPAPATLYAGTAELGQRAVLVGFGYRGVGRYGAGLRFGEHGLKTAAENVIDVVTPFTRPQGPDDDAGNAIEIDFDSVTGVSKNPLGDPTPTPLEGVLASGDSGGALWVQFPGGWRVVGVNSAGRDAITNRISYFARVSTQRAWIQSVFPAVRFDQGEAARGPRRR